MGGILLALIAAMEIQIPGTCPRLADVQRHLEPLLAPGFAARTQDSAVVAEGPDGGVTVLLARADGGQAVTRQLPRAGSCDAQAETIAVLLASWEGEIHPELALRAAPPTPSAGPHGQGGVLAVEARVSPPSPQRRGLAIDAIGVGAGAGWAPDSVAPGATIESLARRRREPLAWPGLSRGRRRAEGQPALGARRLVAGRAGAGRRLRRCRWGSGG